MNYQDFVTSRVKWLPTPQEDLAHAGMGLLGECVELMAAKWDPKNRKEELGDLEFYCEHAMQVMVKIPELMVHGKDVSREEARAMEADPVYWITYWSAMFHNLAKKAWIFRKPLDTLDFISAITRIKICLFFLSNQMGMTRGDIQELNQSKLEKRYPDGYSDAAAIARADKGNGTIHPEGL